MGNPAVTGGRQSRKKAAVLLFSFLLPAAVMLVVYRLHHIVPFGDQTLLTSDLNNQYVHFFSHLRSMLTGEQSWTYTFSKMLGGDTAGLLGYYMLSPLNLIFIFFPLDRIALGVSVLMLLKWGLCGLTMGLYLNRRSVRWSSLAFSLCYALMAYTVGYYFNVMWLDGVYLLPLVVWGLDSLVQRRRFLLYTLSLAASILINYYIGFMLCIFSVLYFAYRMLCRYRVRDLWRRGSGALGTLGLFAGGSLLAGGLSAWLLLPILNSLAGGKAVFSLDSLAVERQFYLSDLFAMFFNGAFDWNQVYNGSLPKIYCGAAILVLAVFFFLTAKISRREKLLSAGLLGSLVLSFYVSGLDMVWHGLNRTSDFPYRYSFIFSFVLILLAWRAYERLDRQTVSRYGTFIFAALLLITLYIEKQFSQLLTAQTVLVTLGLWTAALFLFYLRTGRRRQMAGLLLGLLCMGDMALNAKTSFQAFEFASNSEFGAFIRQTQPVVQQLKEENSQFFRMEKRYSWQLNDAMLFDYRGLTHFSSTEKTDVKDFVGQLGLERYLYRGKALWDQYNQGATRSVDSLLGVKYVLSQAPARDLAQFYHERQMGSLWVYENPCALPVGFMVSGRADAADVWSTDNPFEVQNALWEGMLPDGLSSPLNIPVPAKLENTQNVTAEKDGLFSRTSAQEPAYVEYRLTPQVKGQMFLRVAAHQVNSGVRIYRDGEYLEDYLETYHNGTVCLGEGIPGQETIIRFELKSQKVSLKTLYWYTEDTQALRENYRELAANAISLTRSDDDYLEGTVTATGDKPTLLFTVPAQEGWQAIVDGTPVPIQKIYDVLIGIPLSEGEHHIVLRYTPAGLHAGLIVSLGSAAILAVLAVCARKGFRSWMQGKRFRKTKGRG